MGLFWQTNSYFRQKSSFLWNVYWKIWLKDSMNHLVYATGKFLPNIGRIIAGSVIWTVNLKLLLMYQKKELSYLQIPEMKQFSSNLPDSRYIFHGSVYTKPSAFPKMTTTKRARNGGDHVTPKSDKAGRLKPSRQPPNQGHG